MREKRHTVEDALLEEESKFLALLELSADAVVIADLTGVILQANRRAAAVFGHESPETLVGNAGLELVAPESRALAAENMRLAREENAHPQVTYTLQRRDGTTFAGEISSANITDQNGRPAMFIVAFRDMTESRKAEGAVAQYQVWLRRMAADLVLAEERERRRIASELHDRVGQSLALCRLRMSSLLDAPREDATPLEEIAELLDFTIQDVRTLTVELSPPVLYELSFVDAVSWLGDRTRERAGLEVQVTDDGRNKPLAEDVGIFLFKAIQELLANVTKHAGASRVEVTLSRTNGLISAAVEDDGVGFDSDEQEARLEASGGFGLFSIRERLTPLGGSVEVHSTPGQGTRVTITAPLNERENRK